MAREAADIIGLDEELHGQLTLNAETELFRIGRREVGTDGLDGTPRSRRRRAAGNVRQVPVVVSGARDERRVAQGVERRIALDAVIVQTKSGANYGVVVQRVGKADAR